MKYYLYIIETISDTLYCGIAKDVIKRFKEHQNHKGAKYTKSHHTKKIVYVDIFDDKSSALQEEYRIKKTLTRQKKLELIKSNKQKTQKILDELIV